MPLIDRPDYRRWLDRVESAHRELHGADTNPPAGQRHCAGCGDELNDLDSSCGQCLVCLAERYGREQAEGAASISRVLMAALLSDRDTPVDVIRAAIDEVLDEHESLVEVRLWTS